MPWSFRASRNDRSWEGDDRLDQTTTGIEVPTTSHALGNYGSRIVRRVDDISQIGPRRVACGRHWLQFADDGSRAGNNESWANDDGLTGLRPATTGLRRATMGRARSTMGLGRATMDRRSGTYVCSHAHPCAHAIHFILSTVDLGLTCRLYISYPIPTSKFKKNW